MPKILICGSRGYLGHNFCEFLKLKGQNYDVENFGQTSEIDLKNNLEKIDFHHFDSVYWFIGKNSPSESFVSTLDYMKSNIILPSMVLAELLEQEFSGQFNFISTRLVYGNVTVDAREEDATALNLKSPYALAKKYMESQLLLMGTHNQLNAKILRLGVPYGTLTGQLFNSGTIGSFQTQAEAGEITLFGDGRQKRTFTHILDLFEVLHQLQTDLCGTEIYNIHGETLMLYQVAEIIAAKKNASVNFIPFPKHAGQIESGDTQFDCSKIKKKLKINPLYKFKHWVDAH
jgi:nucleoside-diphosphate-sugar epimerase